MKIDVKSLDARAWLLIVCVPLWFPLAYYWGYFAPQAEPSPEEGGVFLYYGEHGQTLPDTGLDPAQADVTRAALRDTDYFGAFAIGPEGRSGLWTGARTLALARSYALAQCGAGCTIAAERVPAGWDATRSEPVLTPPMARNVAGLNRPYEGHHIVVVGGANAWGYGVKAARRAGGWRVARQNGLADCEARRAAEPVFAPDISPPCLYLPLNDILDLRPKPRLYPAPYTMGLTDLAPVEGTRLVRLPNVPRDPTFGIFLPDRLHVARAAATRWSDDNAHRAGWPEAGDAIALLRCNAGRRPQDPPCVVTHRQLPDPAPPDGVLAVTPELYEAYLAWQQTEGPGAFAISPYAVWGSSQGMKDRQAAIQRAADWCWYQTRRTYAYREVMRDFLTLDLPCRIVAVRDR